MKLHIAVKFLKKFCCNSNFQNVCLYLVTHLSSQSLEWPGSLMRVAVQMPMITCHCRQGPPAVSGTPSPLEPVRPSSASAVDETTRLQRRGFSKRHGGELLVPHTSYVEAQGYLSRQGPSKHSKTFFCRHFVGRFSWAASTQSHFYPRQSTPSHMGSASFTWHRMV